MPESTQPLTLQVGVPSVVRTLTEVTCQSADHLEVHLAVARRPIALPDRLTPRLPDGLSLSPRQSQDPLQRRHLLRYVTRREEPAIVTIVNEFRDPKNISGESSASRRPSLRASSEGEIRCRTPKPECRSGHTTPKCEA